jgi:hypothetical protein
MADLNKAQMVRDYLSEHPKVGPKKIAEELSKKGIEITDKYVSRIKSQLKNSKNKPKPARRGSRKIRSYPVRTLEEALAIPAAIREKNNGNPWNTEDVAQASMGVAKSNNKFFYAAAAARDFDLTIGTRDTDRIELSELGKEIFFAGDEEEKSTNLLKAFFSIDIFKRVFEHYGGADLPKEEYVTNTLQQDFGIDPDLHDEFIKLFKVNCQFLKISKGLKGSQQLPQKQTVVEQSDKIRVVGQPKGKFDRTAFVIMPFSEKGDNPKPEGFFDELLQSVITPAANSAGFAVETAQRRGSDVIQSTIIGQLLSADLVIADLTDHNPNVLFELGIRIAKDLPVVLIKADGTGQIFDVDNMMRVLEYSANLWPTTVKNDVPVMADHIKASWDNRSTSSSYMQILARKEP